MPAWAPGGGWRLSDWRLWHEPLRLRYPDKHMRSEPGSGQELHRQHCVHATSHWKPYGALQSGAQRNQSSVRPAALGNRDLRAGGNPRCISAHRADIGRGYFTNSDVLARLLLNLFGKSTSIRVNNKKGPHLRGPMLVASSPGIVSATSIDEQNNDQLSDDQCARNHGVVVSSVLKKFRICRASLSLPVGIEGWLPSPFAS